MADKPVYSIEKMDTIPYFDIEQYMMISQNTRMDGETAEKMGDLWVKWLPHLNVRKITVGMNEYVAVWLNQEVELEVEDAWEGSPSDAFNANALAQTICMATIRELVPEVAAGGCAPAPKPTAGLKAALESEGIFWDEMGALSRSFAMITHFPYKGACEICYLQDDCPKANMNQQ